MFALYDAAPDQLALKDVIALLYPNATVPKTLSSLRQRYTRKVEGLKLEDITGLEKLLTTRICQPVESHEHIIGEDCAQKGITPSVLEGLDGPENSRVHVLTNTTILELRAYKEKHHYTWQSAQKWMEALLPGNPDLVEVYRVKRSWTSIFDEAARLKKSRSRDPEALKNFLAQPYMYNRPPCEHTKATHPKPQIQNTSPKVLAKPIIHIERDDSEISLLSKKNIQQQRVITSLQNQMDNLKMCKKERNKLRTDLEVSQVGLLQARNTIVAQKQKNYHRRLKRKEDALNQTSIEKDLEINTLRTALSKQVLKNQNMETKHQERLDHLNKLKRERKHLQTAISDQRVRANKYKNRFLEAQDENRKKETEVEDLSQQVVCLQAEVQDHEVETQVDRVYSNEVRQCCVQLQACGVGAKNVPKVMQIVSNELFNSKIPDNKLPCQSSIINFVDEAHVIAKSHVSEELVSNAWDLHSDATTREGRHILNVVATTSIGEQLSMGFTEVAREDSDTLLDVNITLLKEIANFHSDGDDEYLSKIVNNLCSLMSDRAAVNKCFNNKLSIWRQDMLTTTGNDRNKIEKLNFFYCLAHVLLGFSSETEKVLKELESDIIETTNRQLGRNVLPEFKNWKSSEPSTLRTIRTISEALGPRGDEKSGCREDWLAFLDSRGQSSLLTSYRSNRFNSVFQGAAATSFHAMDIEEFVTSSGKDNRLLRSVLQDVKCPEILHIMHGISVMWHHFTKPFWDFCLSRVHYLDLHLYIGPFAECLANLVEDPSPAIDGSLAPVFPDLNQTPLHPLSAKLMELNLDTVITRNAVKALSKGFLNVIQRQMSEQLPGGIHSQPPSAEERSRAEHSKITNLVCENNFADLDYSLNQNRHASLHYLSAIHMVKRNNTLKWLQKKSIAAQHRLWQAARLGRGSLRAKHILQSKECRSKRMELMNINLLKKQALAKRKILQKEIIIRKSRDYGGPLLTQGDVASISTSNLNQRQKHHVLVNEVKHQKLVLNKPGVLRYGTKETVESLTATLLSVLPDGVPQINIIFPTVQSVSIKKRSAGTCRLPQHIRKKVKKSPVCVALEPTPSVNCLQPGLTVAIAYEPDSGNSNWFPGQILNVSDDNTVEVNFLHPKSKCSNQFIWPVPEDRQIVDLKYIISHGFDIEVAGSSGRLWAIPEAKVVQIRSLYQAYCRKYF